MKKKIGLGILIGVLVVAVAGCTYFAIRETGAEQKEAKLQVENKKLQTTLDEKESYIAGQKDTVNELNTQLAALLSEDTDDNDEEEDSKTSNSSFEDEYTNMYAYDPEEEDENQDKDKVVYLTFDDGPSANTPKVLDLLDKYDAKATFFVVHTDEEYAKYLQEIVDRGHTLALHSDSHDYGKIYTSADAFLSDMSKVYDWVYDNTGERCSLFRFPGGSMEGNSGVVATIGEEMDRRGFTYYDWNVSSGDGSNVTTSENIIENICDNVKNYETPVVLMHDATGKQATMDALPQVLENLKEQGYTFKGLDSEMSPVQYRKVTKKD